MFNICKVLKRCLVFSQDYNTLTKYFAYILNEASASKPLFVFLDSLDNLAEDYGARQLAWLPLTLPPHVKLVVSTLPDDIYHCFPILKVILNIIKLLWFVSELPVKYES
jgi:hypothetical protein